MVDTAEEFVRRYIAIAVDTRAQVNLAFLQSICDMAGVEVDCSSVAIERLVLEERLLGDNQ